MDPHEPAHRPTLRPGPAAAPSLRITERFRSIQGEGQWVGSPSSFIRVAGCNLRCTWCDSEASSWAPSGSREPLEALLSWCAAGPRHVVVTGGEPLLFAPIAELTQALGRRGHCVTIETAATRWLPGVYADLLSLSPKLSHSTPHRRHPRLALVHERRRWRPEVVRRWMADYRWQLKFVVRTAPASALAEDLREVEQMVDALAVAPAQRHAVFLMPECTDPAALPSAYRALLPALGELGFSLGLRLHLTLFGHVPGT